MTVTLVQLVTMCVGTYILAIVRLFEHHYYLLSLSILGVAFVFRGIYNVYFHDLRHVPGPFLGGFTDFYKVYIFACKHIPSGTMALHQQFGLLKISLRNYENH